MDLSVSAPMPVTRRAFLGSRGTVVVVVLLLAYLALTVAVVTRSPLLRIDTDVLHLDLHRRYPRWFTAINAYVILGQRGPSTLAAVPWLIWRSWRSRSARPVVLVATALVLLNLSVGVVKVLVGRLGPLATTDAYLPFSGGDIFPSGHTANAVVLYGALATLARRRRRLMAAGAVFVSATVGLCARCTWTRIGSPTSWAAGWPAAWCCWRCRRRPCGSSGSPDGRSSGRGAAFDD